MRATSRSSAAPRHVARQDAAGLAPQPTTEPPHPAPTSLPGKTGLTSLNRLHCFEVVVQESGFKRATSRLHITQPALSYQMKHLEDELGVQLFLRRPGGVSLTDAGRLLYTHVQRVSDAVRRAELAVKELPAVGEVRIGTVNSIGTYFLPHVLAAVHEGHTATIPSLYRARSDDHIEALLAGQVDLALLADPRVDKRLHYETLFEERVSLVWSKSHPLAGAPRVRPETLASAPMVALSSQTPTGALVQKYLESLGVRVEPVVSAEDVLTVKRMVEMGIGAAFLPDMVTHRDIASKGNPAGRLCRAEFDPPLTRSVVLVTWDAVPSSLAVKTVVDEVRRHSASWQAARANANG